MFSRIFYTFGLFLLVSACVSVPPHALSPTEFQKYRITHVSVEGVEVIRSWPAQEQTYVKSNPADFETVNRLQAEPASNFPALRAHIQRVLDERFKLEFASQVTPVFTGTRPVKAIVRLKTFDVPSAARRVLVDQNAKIKAEIDLVDASTGVPVVRYDGPFRSKNACRRGGNGDRGCLRSVRCGPFARDGLRNRLSRLALAEIGQGPYCGGEIAFAFVRRRGKGSHGEREVQPFEAALQHWDDWPCRPWQDVVDGGDHEGFGGERRGDVHGL